MPIPPVTINTQCQLSSSRSRLTAGSERQADKLSGGVKAHRRGTFMLGNQLVTIRLLVGNAGASKTPW